MWESIKSRLNALRLNVNSAIRKQEISRTIDPGKVKHLQISVNCNNEWYGNSYGGFFIIPELLNRNSIIYSFGIGKDLSFDLTAIKNHDCKVFGFDPTPKSIEWIGQQNLPENFQFFDVGIGTKTERTVFFLPKNPRHISGSLINIEATSTERKVNVQLKTLDKIAEELGHTHLDVLKIDIEGAEYDVIENIVDSRLTIDQILIEFHDRCFENGELKSQKAIETLNKNGFKIYARSKSFEEISLVHEGVLRRFKT